MDNMITTLMIETSSKCNLKCPMCPQSLDLNLDKVRRNNFDEKFIEELVKYFPNLKELQLHGDLDHPYGNLSCIFYT